MGGVDIASVHIASLARWARVDDVVVVEVDGFLRFDQVVVVVFAID